MEFNEETILSHQPYSLSHRIKYLNLRYDEKEKSYSLFYEHRCTNGIERIGAERGLDVIGLKLETKNMRIGYKNEGIRFDPEKEFEFLSQFGYSLSLAKKVMERERELDAIGGFSLRWDILRYKNYIPYLELGLDSLLGSELRTDYTIEFGTRINYRYAFLCPFLRYTYQHDLDRYKGISEDFFIAGLKLETLSNQNLLSSQKNSGISPQINMQGYYAKVMGAKDFEWNGNVTLNTDFYHRDNLRIFLNTNVDLISPSGAYRPRFGTYKLEPGIGFEEDKGFLEFVYRHTSRYDVNTLDGFTEHSGFLGLRKRTLGMKTGYKNKGIDFDSPKDFEFLKKIDWEIAGGRFIYTSDYDYDWNAEFSIRYDFLRHVKKICYLEGNLNFLIGDNLDIEYYLESGVRFGGVGDITPFIRYQHKENVNYFEGYSDDYLLAGVRFEF